MSSSSNNSPKYNDSFQVIPRVFESDEKKLNFVISDSGDFIDNIYRETDANTILGIFMGRSNHMGPQHRKYFTAADVIYEGYLYKRGSWFKSWKKRYFVLRKDIRSLCYFESKENLKLLGSIPLSPSTCIELLPPELADNYKFVLEIQPWGLKDKNKTLIWIRADTAEEINVWENELISEATSTRQIQSDSNGDWWSLIMERIPEAPAMSTASRRPNYMLSPSTTISNKAIDSTVKISSTKLDTKPQLDNTGYKLKDGDLLLDQQPPLLSIQLSISDMSSESQGILTDYGEDENIDDEDEEDTQKIVNLISDSHSSTITVKDGVTTGSDLNLNEEFNSRNTLATLSSPELVHSSYDILPEDLQRQLPSFSTRRNSPITIVSNKISAVVSGGDEQIRSAFSRLSIAAQKNLLKLHLGAEEELAAIKRFAMNNKSTVHGRSKRHQLTKIKPDKPSGPAPFRNPLIDRFESSGKLVGVQLSVNLMNICSWQDRIFAAVFSGTIATNTEDSINHIPSGNESRIPTSKSGSLWKQMSVTEIVTVNEKPTYGANCVDLVRIHFSLLQEPLPKDCKYVMIAIYRCDSSDTPEYALSKKKVEQQKFSNVVDDKAKSSENDLGFQQAHLHQHEAIARVVIPIRHWNEHPIFYSQMKVLLDSPVDLSSPMTVDAKATLGVMKLTSGTLLEHRTKFMSAWGVKPYAEMMYSFQTINGQTLSLEQLFASSYSLAVPEAMIKFIQLDRGTSISKLCSSAHRDIEIISAEIKRLSQYVNSIHSQNHNHSHSHTPIQTTPPSSTPLRQSISNLTSIDSFGVNSSVEQQYLSGLVLGHELLEQAYEIISDIQDEFQNSFVTVVENCQTCRMQSSTVTSNRSDSSSSSSSSSSFNQDTNATNSLRKSVWKKHPQWQFSATNLNFHVMLSRHFNFDEMVSMKDIRFPSGYPSINNRTNMHRTNSSNSNSGNSGNQNMSHNYPSLATSVYRRQNTSSIHAIPTITLGCPAAHGLRFKEGGLRRIFEDISDVESRLLWIHMLQSDVPWPSFFKFMEENQKEANILFSSSIVPHGASLLTNWHLDILNTQAGNNSSSGHNPSNHSNSHPTTLEEDKSSSGKDLLREIYTMKRKMELAQRIDIVSSQVLAFALTEIRAIIVLATHIGGSYIDTLQRSLKIGFLLCIESLLSTIGDELGMIEDLDIAVEWLRLVTIRLVAAATIREGNLSSSSSSTSTTTTGLSPEIRREKRASDGKIAMGTSSGVTIRRDTNGRIIVDLELPLDEVEVVKDAVVFITEFTHTSTRMSENFDSKPISKKYATALYFDPHPEILYADQENEPDILAVVELYGVVFTQGINEMQTIANIAQSRDIARQVDMNRVAVERLESYFDIYLAALTYQMHKAVLEMPRHEEMVSSRGLFSSNSSSPTVSTSSTTSSTSSPIERPIQVGKLNRPLSISQRRSIHSKPDTVVDSSASTSNSTSNSNNIIPLSSYGTNTVPSEFDQYLELMYAKVIQSVVKMMDELKVAVRKEIESPMEKHVDVILKFSALCRKLGGTIGILCKSGKDRTGMGVTLEITRSIVEDLGVRAGSEACQVLRTHGVRRMNVYANTGQSKFAFNPIQRKALPNCYRPPVGTYAGNVVS